MVDSASKVTYIRGTADPVGYLMEMRVMAKRMPLTFEEVAERLSYDPDTGVIKWRKDAGKNVKAGDVAGSLKGIRTNKSGLETRYRYIRMDGWETPAARVAWLLHHGEWPASNVVFKDGDPNNLRADNLAKGRFAAVVTEKDGRKRYTMTREAQRHYGLKRYYGITGEQYGAMLAAQGGVCAICANPEVRLDRHGMPVALHVDHDHKTGAVRALLCYKCNSALGSMNDDPALFRKAADYLEKYSGSNVVAFPKEPA